MYCRLPRPGEETSSLQPTVSDVSPETRKLSMADQSPRNTQEKESEDEKSSRKKRSREEKKKEKHERSEKRHSRDLDDKRKHKKDKERRRHDSD